MKINSKTFLYNKHTIYYPLLDISNMYGIIQYVMSENINAINLYENIGFKELEKKMRLFL